jgi:hypothetical protein
MHPSPIGQRAFISAIIIAIAIAPATLHQIRTTDPYASLSLYIHGPVIGLE